MNQILAIAFNTFKEAVRNRILYLILFFALIMIGFSGVLGSLTISDPEKIIKNLGFAAINLFGVAIAVFIGVNLVYNELERKTIYTIVSKPISRWQFLLGKFVGLLMTVYTNLLVMSVFFLFMIHYHVGAGHFGTQYVQEASKAAATATTPAEPVGWFSLVGGSAVKAVVNLVWWNGYAATKNIMPVIFATALELLIVTSFSILFSSFSTPFLSMIFTILTFVAGRLNEDIILFADNVLKQAMKTPGAPIPFIYYFTNAASLVTPNLGVFHRTIEQALYSDTVIVWPVAIAYALVYPTGILFLSMLIFSRRNFK